MIIKDMKNLKRFISYYKPHKLVFALDMIASFLVAIIGMFYPIITRKMLNDFIPDHNTKMIIICGVALLVVYGLRLGFRYFIQYYGHVMGTKMESQMRRDIFRKVEKLPYSYFDENETGRILSKMTSDLREVSELAHHGPENIFIASFTLIGAFVYLLTINWILALILFLMVPILFTINYFFRNKMIKAFRAGRIAQASINADIESSISGIRVTKAFNNLEKEYEKFEKSNSQFVEARKSAFTAMAGFFSVSNFITDIFNVVILIAGGMFLYNGKIALGDYSTFVVSISLFISPINQLTMFMEQFQDGKSGFVRFCEVMEEKEEIDEGTIELKNVEGSIEFKDVYFEYNEKVENILNNVSFKINKGEKIALVGPTGGGKSTICHLLPRFYNIKSGTITIDDNNIYDITLSSLRQNIGIIQQDVFLFAGTIRDNITYGNLNASEEDIQEAVTKANLKGFIDSLPDGLETQIGERGVKLSGGQKQRISIARAFVKNPSILILDEATSALDNTTEFLIQSALDELCKNRTTIVVAHRLSTIRNADRIFVISAGEIKESGSHNELMNNPNGIYKTLYELQFKVLEDKDSLFLNDSIKIG